MTCFMEMWQNLANFNRNNVENRDVTFGYLVSQLGYTSLNLFTFHIECFVRIKLR